MAVPRHIIKATELYEKGKLSLDQVAWKEGALPKDDEFDISIPVYDQYGDPDGTQIFFRVSVSSLFETRDRLEKEVEFAQKEYEDYCADIDRIITFLQSIRSNKEPTERYYVKLDSPENRAEPEL